MKERFFFAESVHWSGVWMKERFFFAESVHWSGVWMKERFFFAESVHWSGGKLVGASLGQKSALEWRNGRIDCFSKTEAGFGASIMSLRLLLFYESLICRRYNVVEVASLRRKLHLLPL